LSCRVGVGRTMSYDAEIEPSSCVSVVAAMYSIVQHVNSAVKSMCSISATPDGNQSLCPNVNSPDQLDPGGESPH